MMYTGIKAFTLSEWFQDLFSDSSDPNVSKWRDGLLHNFLKEWSDRTFSSLEVIWLNVLITLKLDGGFEKQHLHLVRLLSLRLQHSSKFACKLENLKIIQLFTGDEFANEHGQSHATCSIYLESRLFISSLPLVTHSCLTWFLWNRLLKTSTRLNSISDNWHSLQKIQQDLKNWSRK